MCSHDLIRWKSRRAMATVAKIEKRCYPGACWLLCNCICGRCPGTPDRPRRRLGKGKATSCRRFRYSFAIELLERGEDIRMIQELLGRSDGRITMSYSHVLNRGPLGVCSPADLL